jgi:hypothetical protein
MLLSVINSHKGYAMQETLISIQVEPSLREKVEALARAERRSVEEETAYLVENGLRVFEGRVEGTIEQVF